MPKSKKMLIAPTSAYLGRDRAVTPTADFDAASPPTPAPSPTPSYRVSQNGESRSTNTPGDGLRQLITTFDKVYSRLSHEHKQRFFDHILSKSHHQELSYLSEAVVPLLKRDPFRMLPYEISLRILSYVDDPKTLGKASQVSRLWHLILSDDQTWKTLCERHQYRRLSAAQRITYRQSSRLASIPNVPENMEVDSNVLESMYDPEPLRQVPLSYRSHFKHQYLVDAACNKGGRLAAKHVTSDQAVVTSLEMNGRYIVVALDNSRIYVFAEDGRLIHTLFGHVMGVWAITVLGDTLVSGGCDRDVRVWNLKTGECLQILRGHSSTVRCLKMVDERTAISGSRDNTLRVWDIRSGVCLRELIGHDLSVRCIEVVGDICVSGSYDFKAKVWRISTGECLHTLEGHYSQIYSLAFDGKRIATGSLDTSVRIWDAATGNLIFVLQGHTSLVGQLQMKDNTLVTGGSDGAIRVWDLEQGACTQRLAAHDGSVTSLQFSDNRIVSGGSDGRVRVWDMASGQYIRDLSQAFDSVWRVAFKEEKVVILASQRRQIHMELISFSPKGEDKEVDPLEDGVVVEDIVMEEDEFK
ncbi:YALI0A09658p [Yarrowia lipolytica CLIB122]|uniref:YALI0A09658p n=1 Tax=Yarrowia lipolytica (strain CLIB 122 / E 150) TaxID=284591 RepID=Q6CHE8_YARLI|nr:YALI0A09658p [Yarrowia lipolytica CLIB122]CAG83840.1 YALI0A09658p [Yarrowia lipolytica CLIB122]|eukprot:XP_499913.1 YALI0A09658p [Yarrowia lipolytica CLIB122]